MAVGLSTISLVLDVRGAPGIKVGTVVHINWRVTDVHVVYSVSYYRELAVL
jgi:hypothetical protein